MDSRGNGQEWAREAIVGLRQDVRGLRKEIGIERTRVDHDQELVMARLDDIQKQLAEFRGASKLAGALWGGLSGLGVAGMLRLFATWSGK